MGLLMKKLTILIYCVFLIPYFSYSQGNDKKNTNTEHTQSKEDIDLKDWDNPLLREQEFYRQRAFPYESIPDGARINAIQQMEQMAKMPKSQAAIQAQQPEWKNIGPFKVGGRVKSIVHHPKKEGYVFIGAAAGGIWKTTSSGLDWTPLFDYENGIAFGALAIDINHPDTMYAGTGEAVNGGNSYLGAGCFKTTDGGQTWKVIGLTQVGAFSKLYVHPKNSNLIYAGAIKRGQGFYKSVNGGDSWKQTNDKPVTDITINPEDENELFIGISGEGIFYSNDAGETWTARNTGISEGIGRVSVQFAPSNTNILFSLMEINSNGVIYKSTDRGNNWSNSYRGDASFFNNQGWYDNHIEVHPTNPNIVIAGGIDIWRTSDGGSNWRNVTNGYSGGTTHVDQQSACFDPLNPNIVYIGNDGGMYSSIDGGVNWRNINNGLQITQFYAMAIDDSKENVNYGGTQDNGTVGIRGDDWSGVAGGDGFSVVIDNKNPELIYGEYYNGSLWRINFGSGEYKTITNGIPSDDAGLWHSPLIMDQEGTLYHGRGAIYFSFDKGDSWFPLTEKNSSKYSTLAVSHVDPLIIYGGCENGDVFATTDGGGEWNNVAKNGLISRYVTDIATSYLDAGTAYVSFSGYGMPHLFKTTNYGQNWVNLGNDLPDVPVNAIAIHPYNLDEKVIYVGTDIGVFATFDGGVSWLPFGKKLARSPVTDLRFRKTSAFYPNLVLRAATHGRSMWEVPISNDIVTEPEITSSPAGGEIYVSGSRQTISWYGFTPSGKD